MSPFPNPPPQILGALLTPPPPLASPTSPGGWWRLVVGDWWLVAVGSGWRRLIAAGGWRLAVDCGWWLAVGGSLGRCLRAVLNQKKIQFPKNPPALWGIDANSVVAVSVSQLPAAIPPNIALPEVLRLRTPRGLTSPPAWPGDEAVCTMEMGASASALWGGICAARAPRAPSQNELSLTPS